MFKPRADIAEIGDTYHTQPYVYVKLLVKFLWKRNFPHNIASWIWPLIGHGSFIWSFLDCSLTLKLNGFPPQLNSGGSVNPCLVHQANNKHFAESFHQKEREQAIAEVLLRNMFWKNAASYRTKTRNQQTRMQSRKTLLWNKLLNNLVNCSILPLLPYQCTVDRGMWKGVEGKVWSVKKVECWVGNTVCRVWRCVKWGLWSVEWKWKVWGGKCEV